MVPGFIVGGALMIAWPLAIRIGALRAAERNHRVIPRPRGWVLRSPMMWAGVVWATVGINQTAGTIALAIGMLVLLVLVVRLLVLIVRGLIKSPPSIRRGWRRIGDPNSWRGTPSDAAERDT